MPVREDVQRLGQATLRFLMRPTEECVRCTWPVGILVFLFVCLVVALVAGGKALHARREDDEERRYPVLAGSTRAWLVAQSLLCWLALALVVVLGVAGARHNYCAATVRRVRFAE